MSTFLIAAFASMAISAPPGSPTNATAGTRSGEQLVRFQCVLCHGAGMAGAPRIGDRREWEKRAGGDVEKLVRSATQGRGAMPPNGGLADVSQQELRAAIDYMREGASPGH